MKIKKSDWSCIVIFLVALEIMFLWCIDISISAIMNDGIVTNGFITNNPIITYHVALYGLILNTVAFAFITIHHIHKGEKEK